MMEITVHGPRALPYMVTLYCLNKLWQVLAAPMEVQGLEFLLGACRRFRAVFNVGSWYCCNSVLYYCSLKGNCWQMLHVYLN
jgi:hypothetical protein